MGFMNGSDFCLMLFDGNGVDQKNPARETRPGWIIRLLSGFAVRSVTSPRPTLSGCALSISSIRIGQEQNENMADFRHFPEPFGALPGQFPRGLQLSA
jgi:hypothetical protein